LMQMQMEDVHAQRQLAIQQSQQVAADRKRSEQFRQSIPSPQMQASQQALAGGGGPTVGNAAQMRPVDPRLQMLHGAMQAGMGSPLDYINAANPQNKIKDYKAVRAADGSVSYVGLTDDGRVVQTGQQPFEKPEVKSFGNFMGGIDPITGKVTQYGAIGQSADNKANNATAMRGQNMVDARSRQANEASVSKPFEVTGPNGPMLVQQTKDGKIVPVDGYTPKTAPDKPLAPSVVKNITEARDNALTIASLSGSFKPEFAGKGVLGLGADMQMSASGNLGADTDAVEWWKNYRKQAELIERHALFGAALTPTEQASWRSADIGPGMDAKVVARNLATREKFTKQVLEAARQDSIDAGHSETRVNAIAGRKPMDAGGQKPSGQKPSVSNW
jgi:hypothetical protein